MRELATLNDCLKYSLTPSVMMLLTRLIDPYHGYDNVYNRNRSIRRINRDNDSLKKCKEEVWYT